MNHSDIEKFQDVGDGSIVGTRPFEKGERKKNRAFRAQARDNLRITVSAEVVFITRGPGGQTWTTSGFGDGAITRGPGGQTITTDKFGDGYVSRDSKGGTTPTTSFGQGSISRGSSGSVTTDKFGNGSLP